MARTSELLSSCWTSAGAVVPVLCGDVSAFTVEKRVAAVAKARDREIGISAPDLVVARDTRLSGAGQTARRECGAGHNKPRLSSIESHHFVTGEDDPLGVDLSGKAGESQG
jgi:hypothetical protein